MLELQSLKESSSLSACKTKLSSELYLNLIQNMQNIYVPLAEQMRPAKLTEVFGQDHLIGPEGLLTLLA